MLKECQIRVKRAGIFHYDSFVQSQKVFSSTSNESRCWKVSSLLQFNPLMALLHVSVHKMVCTDEYSPINWKIFNWEAFLLLKWHNFYRWEFDKTSKWKQLYFRSTRDHHLQFGTENAFLFFIIRIQFILFRHRTDFLPTEQWKIKKNFHIAFIFFSTSRLVSA